MFVNSTLNNISESSIVPVSTYSNIFYYNKIYEKAGVVYIQLEISDIHDTISTYDTLVKIGTLPSRYLPKHRMFVSFNILDDRTASYMNSGSCLIEMNGDIKIIISTQCNFSSIIVAYPL